MDVTRCPGHKKPFCPREKKDSDSSDSEDDSAQVEGKPQASAKRKGKDTSKDPQWLAGYQQALQEFKTGESAAQLPEAVGRVTAGELLATNTSRLNQAQLQQLVAHLRPPRR